MPRLHLGNRRQVEPLITEKQWAPCSDRTAGDSGPFFLRVHLGTFFTLITPAKESKTSSDHARSMSVNS